MNESDSKTISALRFPLAVMVVAIHSYFTLDGWSYDAVSTQGLGCNLAQFFMIAISNVLTHIAVPTFFLISGYLFFVNFGDCSCQVWKKKYSSRIKTLVVPYIIWIFLYIIWLFLGDFKTISSEGIINWLKAQGGIKMFWNSYMWNLDRLDLWGQPAISSSPVLIPFWFLRDLIVCVVFCPLFYLFFKKTNSNIVKIVAYIVLGGLYFTQTSLRLPGFSSASFFFFGIGTTLSLADKSIIDVFSKRRFLIWSIFVVLLVIEVAFNGHNTLLGNIIYPFYVFIGVASILALKPHSGGGTIASHFSFLHPMSLSSLTLVYCCQRRCA